MDTREDADEDHSTKGDEEFPLFGPAKPPVVVASGATKDRRRTGTDMTKDLADQTTGRLVQTEVRGRERVSRGGREIVRNAARNVRPEVVENLAHEIEAGGLAAALGRKKRSAKVELVR